MIKPLHVLILGGVALWFLSRSRSSTPQVVQAGGSTPSFTPEWFVQQGTSAAQTAAECEKSGKPFWECIQSMYPVSASPNTQIRGWYR